MSSETTARRRTELLPGDQFTRPMPRYRGKPTPVIYTVVGYETYRDRDFLTVRSALQGEGHIAVDALPEIVEVMAS